VSPFGSLKSWRREEYRELQTVVDFVYWHPRFENSQFSGIWQIKEPYRSVGLTELYHDFIQLRAMSSCSIKYKVYIKIWVFDYFV
jgi:hypothetical protein